MDRAAPGPSLDSRYSQTFTGGLGSFSHRGAETYCFRLGLVRLLPFFPPRLGWGRTGPEARTSPHTSGLTVFGTNHRDAPSEAPWRGWRGRPRTLRYLYSFSTGTWVVEWTGGHTVSAGLRSHSQGKTSVSLVWTRPLSPTRRERRPWPDLGRFRTGAGEGVRNPRLGSGDRD